MQGSIYKSLLEKNFKEIKFLCFYAKVNGNLVSLTLTSGKKSSGMVLKRALFVDKYLGYNSVFGVIQKVFNGCY